MTKASDPISLVLRIVGVVFKPGGRIAVALEQFSGNSLGARARRSSIWSAVDFGGSQGLRLASNLLLTRLLFPEAFGLMALVSVVMMGLALFSDTGIRQLIVQHERGDDPAFLDTAWTVQAIRGLILWLVVLAIAGPVASLYDEWQLAELLPVAGLALVIEGLKPTSVYTVNRHLAMGRYVRIKLGVQAIGLAILAVLAWQLQTVWALVIGNLISASLGVAAYRVFLPAKRNHFRLKVDDARKIFDFGKWIFLSTAAGFVINQGDRAVLGLFVPLEVLGVYNVGYFLASVPVFLNIALQQTVMTPLYRMKPPSNSEENRAQIFRARRLIAISMLTLSAVLAFAGPTLVEILYDDRYVQAGAMITLFSVSVVPLVTLSTVGAALIGVGDSRAMFFVFGTTAVLQTVFLLGTIKIFGVSGALISPGISILVSYPVRLMFSFKYRVFDPVQDIALTIVGYIAPITACITYREDLLKLIYA